ncbi:isoprenyl transferase [Arthrobacter sp. HMSC08H08]|uniref:isoprenyl transferase n=1 Tax=Arthrobacter sp. HMSC08H08 TaxID=1581143 RepID=UPI0008A25B3A|nr:isoprenyl transferase [Arthrobacter sp. HMSC08H08]OFT22243.1 isoprenyl transferase [Arthrobacter sp. HMSC08H08]
MADVSASVPAPGQGAVRFTPDYKRSLLPHHVGIVMDGNGRWANQRGLPRTEGHRAGEQALLDVVAGAIEAGIKHVSVYAFSTENWKRSPDEVRFLMGFSRDVLRRQRDTLNEWGVRVRWSGERGRLWKSVISELETAEQMTRNNTVMDLVMCVNYGGRSEIMRAVREIASDVASGALSERGVTEKALNARMYQPDLPDVDLFLRTSGEHRISNFLLWQSAYAELVFLDTLWPDMSREVFWDALGQYVSRDRRFGGAVNKPASLGSQPGSSPAINGEV